MPLHKLFGILLSTIFHNQLLPAFLASSSHFLSPPLQVYHTAVCSLEILDSTTLSLVSVLAIATLCAINIPYLPPLFNCPLNLHVQDCSSILHFRKSSQHQVCTRTFLQVPKYPEYVPIMVFIPLCCSFLTLLPVRLRIREHGLSFCLPFYPLCLPSAHIRHSVNVFQTNE